MVDRVEVAAIGPDELQPPPSARDGCPVLVVVRGPNAGSRFAVRGLVIVGRRDDSDIVLDDVSVSRRHAMAVPEGDGVVIEDLGSLNGTYVGGERIDRATVVNHGEIVLVGRYRLVLVGAAAIR